MTSRKQALGITVIVSLMTLGLGVLGGIFVVTPQTPSRSQSSQGQLKKVQSGIVDLVAVATPELLDAMVKLAGFGKNDLLAEKVICSGVLVSDQTIVVPRRCILHGDLIGRPSIVQVRGIQGQKVPIVEILAIDQQLDLALIRMEPISESVPLDLAGEVDLNTISLFAFKPSGAGGDPFLIQAQYAGTSDPQTFKVTGVSGVQVPGMVFVDAMGRLLGLSSGGKFQVGGGPVFAVSGRAISQWLGALELKNKALKDPMDSNAPRGEELSAAQSLDFKPTRLLQTLGFTVQESSIPYFKRELEGIKVKIGFPIKPDEFDRSIVGQVSDQVEAAFVKLQAENEMRSAPMLTWDKLVFDKNKSFFSAQRSLKHRTHLTYDGGVSLSPDMVVVTPPLSFTQEPQLISTQSFEVSANERPRLMGDSAELDEDQSPDLDQVRSSEPPFQPRLLARFFHKPLVTVRLRAKDRASQSAQMAQRELFEGIVGDSGLMVYGDFRFVKPDRQREVLIQSLDEPLQTAALKDTLGREWQYFGFDVLGAYAIDTWCGALPGGQLCVSKSFALLNPAIHQAYVNLSGKYGLSQYLVEPQFWSIHSLTQFQTDGHLNKDPLMGDFSLASIDADSKGVVVTYQSSGINMTHTGLDKGKGTQMRLIGGFRGQALAHEIYDYRENEARLCQVGLMTKDLKVPKEALLQTVRAKGADQQIYSYCVPVEVSKGHPALVRTAVLGAKVLPFGVKVATF